MADLNFTQFAENIWPTGQAYVVGYLDNVEIRIPVTGFSAFGPSGAMGLSGASIVGPIGPTGLSGASIVGPTGATGPMGGGDFGIACSDETTAITTGIAKVTFRMPWGMNLTGIRGSVNTAPTGSTIIIDLNKTGVSVLSTKLSIDAEEKTSVTAASQAVISTSTLEDDSEMTIDFDQVGLDLAAGKGVKIWLLGSRL